MLNAFCPSGLARYLVPPLIGSSTGASGRMGTDRMDRMGTVYGPDGDSLRTGWGPDGDRMGTVYGSQDRMGTVYGSQASLCTCGDIRPSLRTRRVVD